MFEFVVKDFLRLLPGGGQAGVAARVRALVRGVGSPGFQAIMTYRAFRWARQHHVPTQPFRYWVERMVEITAGVSIPAEADFGPGLRIHHFGGIIVHPSVKVGKGCTLYHGVTLGTDGLTDEAPCIGDDVLIGAGAKVLGAIEIGDRCRIGANAVVVESAPPDTVLVGVPARPIGRRRHAGFSSRQPGGTWDDAGDGADRTVVPFPSGRPERPRGT